jgi:hypothetical protein
VLARYIFLASVAELAIGAESVRSELWLGIEIESENPVDLESFSRETGLHLVPSDGMSAEELAHVGVREFKRFEL